MKGECVKFKTHEEEHDEAILELQRLLACYQIASSDDKKVVWAVLNKYAKSIAL